MTDYPFSLDGPHSPDETRRVADLAAECIRYLNRATMPAQAGLEYPSDVADLIGNLKVAVERIPQMLGQCAYFLRGQTALAGLADTGHEEAALWARICANDLQALADQFAGLAGNLARRQSDLSTLYVKETP